MSALRAFVLAASLGAAGAAFALVVPDRPAARVNDWAGVLSTAARDRVEAVLEKHERETGAQIAVAIFPGLQGEDTDDFTNRMFEQWKLGRKGVDDGVLLAIFVADRRARIEVGYGLEDKLTDALSRRILETALFPRLREGDWDGAVEGSAGALVAVARGETPPSLSQPRNSRRGPSIGVPLIPVLIVILAVLFILSRLRGAATMTRRGRRRGLRAGDIFWGGGPWSGGGGSWGGGGGGGWGGGGGFSGGGGMSGGGGASGSW